VSHVSAEPTPTQCPGPWQLWSIRHWPLAQVRTASPSGVHAMESGPGLQLLPATRAPGAGGGAEPGGAGGAPGKTRVEAMGTWGTAAGTSSAVEDAEDAASSEVAWSRVQAGSAIPRTAGTARTRRMARE
jgi:hypothetical protein